MNAVAPRLAAGYRAGRRSETWQEKARCAIEYGPKFDREPYSVQVACCEECPVREQCLDFAFRTEGTLPPGSHSILPIYAGTTYDERRQMRRAVAS